MDSGVNIIAIGRNVNVTGKIVTLVNLTELETGLQPFQERKADNLLVGNHQGDNLQVDNLQEGKGILAQTVDQLDLETLQEAQQVQEICRQVLNQLVLLVQTLQVEPQR